VKKFFPFCAGVPLGSLLVRRRVFASPPVPRSATGTVRQADDPQNFSTFLVFHGFMINLPGLCSAVCDDSEQKRFEIQ